MGHSIANGVGATDTTYGGVATPAGITVRDAGATIAAWPSSAGAGPDPGVLPHIAAGLASGSTLIRRAANGALLSQVETQFIGEVQTDLVALGKAASDVDVVYLMIGENDAQNTTESDAYAARIGQVLDAIERAFPLARVVLQDVVTTDAGGYPEFAAIRTASAAGVALRTTRALSSRAGITTHDTVHYDLAGYAAAGLSYAAALATTA